MLTGIALLPDSKTRGDLVAFRQSHSLQISGPALGTEENLPHMSILQCHFHESLDRELVLDTLVERISATREPLVLGDAVYQPHAWVFAQLRRDPWLVDLQDLALALTKASIDRARATNRPGVELSPQESQSYLKYGYRYVGPAFMPHITLGRTPDFSEGLSPGLVREFRASFGGRRTMPVEVAFYRAGESGVFAERLTSRELR